MKRSLTLAVAFVLVWAPGFAQQKKPAKPKPAPSKSAPSKSAKKSPNVGFLRSNLSNVRSKKAAAQKNLRVVRGKIRVVKGTLEEVSNRIGDLEVAIVDTRDRLSAGRKEQSALGADLQVLNHRLQLRTQEARARIKALRIKGQETFVSAILGAKSVGDLASRKFVLERIAKKDHDLFNEVNALRTQVVKKKNRQDALVREIAGLAVKQQTQQGQLQESREDQKQLLGQLRDKEGDLRRLVAKLDAEENALEATIAAFMRDRSRTSKLVKPSGRLLMPVAGGRIGSGFGMRMHPILRYRRMHKGCDIGARSGTPIRAAADGVVITATRMSGYGNVIVLGHGGGISTLYAHCSALLRAPGATVRKGDVIARVGSTGLSTAPHLHFEVHVNGKAVNPRSWL